MYYIGGAKVAYIIAITLIARSLSLPVTRMRVCVQSADPLRLPSQCVFCNNRMFQPTVRQCTGMTYLPANLTVEEGYCMQMPMLRPQSYLGVATTGTAIQQPHAINTVNTEDDYDSEALFADTPVKRRPPAPITVGRPQRPQRPAMRPFLFGKRSVDSKSKIHHLKGAQGAAGNSNDVDDVEMTKDGNVITYHTAVHQH